MEKSWKAAELALNDVIGGRSMSDIVMSQVLNLRGRDFAALPESFGCLQNLKLLVLPDINLAISLLAFGDLTALQVKFYASMETSSRICPRASAGWRVFVVSGCTSTG